ncbi:MAG: hypothetical protein GVY33_10795, partial [Alphaproteobacteria bacterium]|nr:hypothetical protein [Alphaproteobacteria bacterium]
RGTFPPVAAAVVLGVAAIALAQETMPPVIPDAPERLADQERQIDPATYDSFEDWLAERGTVPGLGTGGFLASELLGRDLHARNGDDVGRIVDIALDDKALARVLLVRRSDDSLRAVPVSSVMVRTDDALFTELTPAQVEALPPVDRPAG